MRVRRPCIFLLAGLWIGLLIGGNVGPALWVFVFALAPLVLSLLMSRKPRHRVILTALCLLLLGILRSPESVWNRVRIPSDVAGCGKFPVVLRVRTAPFPGLSREQVKAHVSDVVIGYPSLRGKAVLLRTLSGPAAPVGEEFTASGTFHVPSERLNPHGVDGLRRSLRQGIIGGVTVSSIGRPAKGSRLSWFSAFRGKLEDLIRSASGIDCSGMIEAMVLGNRSDLSPRAQALMIKAGTYHVLAISGLHVGIVVLLVMSALTFFGFPRGLRIGIAVLCVLCYVGFTGARPSAQRAGMLFLVLSLCRLIQWRVDYPNAVCAAGTLLLLVFPHLAWDVGFKLSLAAVFGITLLVPQLHTRQGTGASKLLKVKEYATLGILASFSAQAFTLPLVVYHFGRVSLLGPVSNLIVLPLVTLVVAAGLEASIAAVFWERLALVFMKAASTVVSVILLSMSSLTCLIDPVVFTGRPGLWKIIVYSVALAHLGLMRPAMNKRLKLCLLLAAYAFMVVPLPTLSHGLLEITFIYVGDGDACLVETPSGEILLIDAGPAGTDYDAGRLHILPLLALKGRKHLDAIIVTHPHNDHYGGLAALMGTVEIDEILVGTLEGEAPYEQLPEAARLHDIPVRQIARGDGLVYGDVTVDVLHPSEAYLRGVEDPNAQSVVFRLSYGETSFLFTGDLTPAVQRELVDEGYDLRCDVLKVPHHGAPDAVAPDFLDALGAGTAVVSVGSRFSSHPSPETVELLESKGLRTFSTISDGAITITSDGTSIRIRTEMHGWLDKRSSGLKMSASGS